MSSSDIKVVVDYSDLTGLIKTSKQTEQSLSLVARSFAKTKDQKAYMTGINQIVKAQQNLDAKSRMSRKEIMKLGAAMRQEAVFAEQLAVATARASTHINAMGKSSNRAGVAMQQTGYQVGDFLVQVQSGTNPMVAFGQQATQLVGVLYLLPQATLAARVSILGLQVSVAALIATAAILIPLISAIGVAWMASGRNGDSFKETLDGLSESFDDYITAASGANTKTEDLISTYGRITPEILELEERLQALQLRQVALDAAAAQKQLSEFRFGDFNPLTGSVDEIRKVFDTTNDRARILKYALDNIGKAEGPEQVVEALQSLSAKAIDVAGGVDSLTDKQIEFLTQVTETEKQFQQLVNILGIVKNKQKEVNDAQDKGLKSFDRHIEAYKKYKEKIEKANADTEESIRLERQKLALLSMEQEEGKETAKYRRLVYSFERENLKLKLQAQGVSEGLIATRLAQLAVEREITSEIEKQKEVTYNLMEGGAAATSLRKYGGRGTTDDRDPTQNGKSIYSNGTTKKDSRKSGQEIVENLLKQARHKAKLVDLNAEEARYAQLLYTMQENNAKAKQPLDQKELEMSAMKIQAIREETLAREQQKKVVEDLAKTIGDAMSNSMMSIVDGTKSVKEAFKSMASDIIKHLYKVLVVQQMVNAFGGFLGGSSNSGIASIGKALQSYDNGGYTGNGSRSGGLDGKGGFMAMLHPQETVVDHSKGQSGGVTVVQNINISTGVQQTVRSEIRQMMPQIAQSAKNAVVDSKRRGGNYGRAMA